MVAIHSVMPVNFYRVLSAVYRIPWSW